MPHGNAITTVRLKARLQAFNEIDTILTGLMKEYRADDGQVLEMDKGAWDALDRARDRVRTRLAVSWNEMSSTTAPTRRRKG